LRIAYFVGGARNTQYALRSRCTFERDRVLESMIRPPHLDAVAVRVARGEAVHVAPPARLRRLVDAHATPRQMLVPAGEIAGDDRDNRPIRHARQVDAGNLAKAEAGAFGNL